MRNLRQEEIKRLESMVALNQGNPLPVAIYARKSREDKENASLDQQISACSDFVRGHSNLMTLSSEFIFSEDNVSGFYLDNRKQLQKMLEALSNKQAFVVLVTKTDRLTRSSGDTLSLLRLFDSLGVVFISGDEQGDFSATGVFAKQVIAASNEFTVRRAIEDTMAAKKRKAEKGFSCGGPGSFGYKVVGKRYVIDPIESLAVEKAFNLYLLGNSLSEVAETLNAEGFKTRTGKNFKKTSVLSILKNERNYGLNIWNSEKKRRKRSRISYLRLPEVSCEDAVEKPIITKETFDKVQQLLINKTQGRNKTNSPGFLLTGLIKCSCGASMTGNSTRGGRNKTLRRTYICSARKEKHTCSMKDVNADYLEKVIRDYFNDGLNKHLEKNGLPLKAIRDRESFINQRLTTINKDITSTEHLIEKLIVQKAASMQPNLLEAIDKVLLNKSDLLNHLKDTSKQLTLANQDLINADKLPANIDWFSNFSLSKEFLVSQIDSIIVDAANIIIKLR
jgi:DNA invertase Pin-like site-specific DNA recombinase